MCHITKDIIIKANERTMNRSNSQIVTARATNHSVTVSAYHRGVTYSHNITVNELRDSYAKSLKNVVR